MKDSETYVAKKIISFFGGSVVVAASLLLALAFPIFIVVSRKWMRCGSFCSALHIVKKFVNCDGVRCCCAYQNIYVQLFRLK